MKTLEEEQEEYRQVAKYITRLQHHQLYNILTKSTRLQTAFEVYNDENSPTEQIEVVKRKFVSVWGETIAAHFLSKYSDANNLIANLDHKNARLFLEKF